MIFKIISGLKSGLFKYFYRSSEKTQRGFCPKCGGALCALDDDSASIMLKIASFNEPNLIVLGKQHSYKEKAPSW
jgi:hypothetical protein